MLLVIRQSQEKCCWKWVMRQLKAIVFTVTESNTESTLPSQQLTIETLEQGVKYVRS